MQTEIDRLREEAQSWRNLYLEAKQQSYDRDYIVENQKRALETTRKTLERYEQQNNALKSLLVLEWD